MIKKLTLIFVLSFNSNIFSQNLYVTKRDYSNSSNYVHSLQKLNSLDGTVINNTDFTTSFPSSYSPESLTFNSQTNEILGISGNIITKSNVITNSETSFTLPLGTSTNYGGLVIAENRLFVTARDYSVTPEINYIQEINQANGEIINSHILISNIQSYNRDLTYLSLTNEILGLCDNIIYKFNILNNTQTTLILPILTNVQYDDIIVAENRLFATTRDYSVTPNIIALRELSLIDGSIINTYNYVTNLENYSYIESLTFLANTREICGITQGYSNDNYHFKIVKYNIANNTDASFDLPILTSIDYDEIISTSTEENLSTNNFAQNTNYKIVRAFNILGQEIPIETANQIIIVQYENGEISKIYNKN
jgi:hypothetical protein